MTFLLALMAQFNEVITAATVIVAASLWLYNLTRNQRDRVIRSSSALLACVTLTGIADVFISLARTSGSLESWIRIGWIGTALAPAALFHLSDALLATTGLVSRGRRRRVVRILYWYAIVFVVAGARTDLILHDLVASPIPIMRPGPLVLIYVIYFIGATAFAFNNVIRARRRALTATTRRRLTYLLFSLITPALGLFPFSLLFPSPGFANPLLVWVLINLSNLAAVFMLAFMAYPLAFFGANKPDRVIKVELLHFILRGPVIGVVVLIVILTVPRLSLIGFQTESLTPFFTVATVLFFQWTFTLIMPFLERRLIYTGDQDAARQVQELSRHLITESDAKQLLETVLATLCDLLRAPQAFASSLQRQNGHSEVFRLEQHIGQIAPELATLPDVETGTLRTPFARDGFMLYPLFSQRENREGELIGVVGVAIPVADAREAKERISEPDRQNLVALYTMRAARVIDDLNIQQEVSASLQDAITAVETPVPTVSVPPLTFKPPTTAQDSADAVALIRDALRDYWGGERLTDERLLQIDAVRAALADHENDLAKAVRSVLQQGIERLKPDGTRSMTATEWTMYNILELRFIKGRKVREVAGQLVMSEPDFYRKQKLAIDQLARIVQNSAL